jgi:CubicO group peptidase (beta-lactamase class C family)
MTRSRILFFFLLVASIILTAADPADIVTLPVEIQQEVDARVQETLPGYESLVIGLLHSGRIVLTRAYGQGRVDAVYEYGSVSKPVTSAILLKLRQAGKLRSLDDKLWTYMPRFKWAMPEAYRNVPLTLRQLLSHRGGIPHNDEAPMINGILNLKFRPGSNYLYSTPGYGLLGMVITAITGLSYSEAVEKYVGKPLNAPSMKAYDKFIAPGAFVVSDIGDLARFALGMMSSDYLPEPLRSEAWQPLANSYALGWFIANAGTEDMTVFHGGSNGRPRAYLLLKPSKNTAVVILAQKKEDTGFDVDRLAEDLLASLEHLRP